DEEKEEKEQPPPAPLTLPPRPRKVPNKADSLPDLRLLALLSGLQVLVLLPLLFQEVQAQFGWYRLTGQNDLTTWTWFIVDQAYLRSLPSFVEVFPMHNESIRLDADEGRYLIVATRYLFWYFVVLTVVQIVKVLWNIGDAIKAVRTDH